MDVAGLTALLAPDGWDLLRSLPPYDEADVLGLSERLRAEGHSPALVAAALTQARLRARAGSKFGPFAPDLLYTAEGLEQATRLPVAARHARRFVEARVDAVADLGCGIGGDALAMAGLGLRVEAVESDPVTAAVATVNLRLAAGDATVRHGDATRFPDGFGLVSGAWADPARRAGGRRIADPQAWSPPLSWALELPTAGAAAGVRAVGVKVAPGIDHDRIPFEAGWQAEWTSVDGDVVEAVLWHGAAAESLVRRAADVLVTDPDSPDAVAEVARVTDADAPPADEIGAGEIGDLLYEPDGAVIRAGLVTAVAAAVGGRLIDPSIAFVTAGTPAPTTPLATVYEVEAVLPWGLKRLRGYLSARDVGHVVVKRRGSPIDPDELRTALRLSGEGTATVVLTRALGRRVAVVCHPA
ncbi:MAG: SAM-dependent methyltransferase [Kineosporiaceae bacterium]